MKAVKEKDPNGNSKSDEIGYADVGLNNLIYYLRGVSSPARSPSPWDKYADTLKKMGLTTI